MKIQIEELTAITRFDAPINTLWAAFHKMRFEVVLKSPLAKGVALVLHLRGENVPGCDFTAPKYHTIDEWGEFLLKKMKWGQIMILESLDGALQIKARVVYTGGVYALNVGLVDHELPKLGRARMLPKHELAHYLGQFRIIKEG